MAGVWQVSRQCRLIQVRVCDVGQATADGGQHFKNIVIENIEKKQRPHILYILYNSIDMKCPELAYPCILEVDGEDSCTTLWLQ